MGSQDEADHYVPADVVPEIDAAHEVGEFFRMLSANGVGGAVVRHRTGSFYVTGQRLGEAIEAQAAKMGFEAATAKTIGDYLPAVVTNRIQPQPVGADTDVAKVLADAGAQSAVHRVVEGELLKGLLFVQEATRSTVTTAPPIWLCQDGDENTDPDHGDCAWCPRSIKEMKNDHSTPE